ncbi:hypothetical protein CRG98_010735 [Punica granatum]|uniref:RNase H type-1 domain-containing protein n=1 Tax=Punica granatum TaxID=22663 RepID=A0A2I0KKP0_PUNGR|nr:hypothetical protein CRG98_010735 [Punica granatum]
MLQYWDYEEFVIHSFQDSLSGSALDWFTSLKAEDIPTWADLSRKFIDQYQYYAETPPTLLELSMMEMAQGQRMEGPTSKGEESSKKAPATTTSSSGRKGKEISVNAVNPAHPTPQQYSIQPISPGPNFDPTTQDQSKHCEYHQGAPGHTLDNCWRLRDEIQKRIDNNRLTFNAVRPPNVQANPLPDHRPSSGSSINMITICTLGEDANEQDNPLPFVIDYTPKNPRSHLTHSRALHIFCKCNNYIIGRVMIDNGSALNVCPVTTLKQMNVDLNRVRPSQTAVRAFDGSRREHHVPVLDIPNAFSLLLGRLWIHSVGAVPSSLHQRLKFIVEEKLIMGINRPTEVEEYKNRRGLGFRSSCPEIIEARRGNHLHRLVAHYGKLNRGIPVPLLSHFFPGPPRIIGGTLDGPSSDSDDTPVALLAVYAVTEGFTSAWRRKMRSLTTGPQSRATRLLHSNPNLRNFDSNPFEEHLSEPQPVYFGEGLPEDGQVPEMEESLRRLEDHQITSVEPTEEINVGTEEEPCTLKIGTALDPAQRAQMIDFLREYQELRLQRASLLLRIKEEVVKQINAGFFEVCNYSEWVANIVPVEKKDGRVRVCVDYPDLNKASPKDNFPLPHIDVLVDNTARHAQFSFMDYFSGYNQIRMAEENKPQNAGATYQRAMVSLFHNMMHKEVEVYVDDMIAKCKEGEDHLVNLKRLFNRLKEYKLRLNPAKCTFGARSGKLLGFVVSKRGIEVDSDKVKAIKELPPPSTIREYRLYHTIRLLSKADPLRYLLDSPSSMRNIAKWRCQLMEYDIEYVSRTSVKGQAIADHLAEFPINDDTPINADFPDEGILQVDEEKDEPTWKMYFDGAVNSVGSGVGAVLISPDGRHYLVAAKVDFSCTNNVAEYEACTLGLQAAIDFKVKELEVFGDSMLTIFQTLGQWKTKDAKLVPYHEYLEELAKIFEKISFTYTPRAKNQFVDVLATLASIASIIKGNTLRRLAVHYFLSGETLYRRSFDATLLRCIDVHESRRLMEEVHEGNCEPHMNGLMLAKKLMRLGYYWSTMETDCVKHVRHYHRCQVYADQIKAPPNELRLMTAPWPFSMWGMDCYQQRMARAFNAKVRRREFSPDDLVLRKVLHVAPDSRGKFSYKYDGPFVDKETFFRGTIILSDMDSAENALSVNADAIKKYYP